MFLKVELFLAALSFAIAERERPIFVMAFWRNGDRYSTLSFVSDEDPKLNEVDQESLSPLGVGQCEHIGLRLARHYQHLNFCDPKKMKLSATYSQRTRSCAAHAFTAMCEFAHGRSTADRTFRYALTAMNMIESKENDRIGEPFRSCPAARKMERNLAEMFLRQKKDINMVWFL
ncbi:hypothetical protein AB6A40_001618 [Gnathostoma spinigerum]|uniref:Uncharacterized protein n=1 Tax=Gnathostoma spinigerum TaxID=75299 RepID=A0ABD6E4K7_9BILA